MLLILFKVFGGANRLYMHLSSLLVGCHCQMTETVVQQPFNTATFCVLLYFTSVNC